MLDTTLELRSLLGQLHVERALAIEEGLGGNAAYMDDLDEELVFRTHLYVIAAVTDIATLRAELDAPLVG